MDYEIIFSRRKTISLQVRHDGIVIVRAPMGSSKKFIDEFVQKHSDWIEKQRQRVRTNPSKMRAEYTSEQIAEFKQMTKQKVHFYINKWCAKGVKVPKAVKITSARTRFGSCSPKGTVCFSCFLCLYDESAIEYVVVHELMHLYEHNHSPRFWANVRRALPDYKDREKLLKD